MDIPTDPMPPKNPYSKYFGPYRAAVAKKRKKKTILRKGWMEEEDA